MFCIPLVHITKHCQQQFTALIMHSFFFKYHSFKILKFIFYLIMKMCDTTELEFYFVHLVNIWTLVRIRFLIWKKNGWTFHIYWYSMPSYLYQLRQRDCCTNHINLSRFPNNNSVYFTDVFLWQTLLLNSKIKYWQNVYYLFDITTFNTNISYLNTPTNSRVLLFTNLLIWKNTCYYKWAYLIIT